MFSISNATTNPLITDLQSQGLSATKAQLVEKDLEASIAAASGGTTGTSSASKADPVAVRKALDQRIADDVASGALSQDDADKISKALDDMAAKSSDSPVAAESAVTGAAASDTASTGASASAGGASGGGGGGGGGGGSSSKTELSRTVTVAGGMKTTTITYTDNSTETTTTVASSSDEAKQSGAQNPKADASASAPGYTPKIEPGSLVEAYA